MPRCADPACGRWRPARLVPRRLAGVHLNGGWHCSAACAARTVREDLELAGASAGAPAPRPMRLGAYLRHLGAISDADLADAVRGQRASGRRIGEELVSRRVLAPEVLLRGLAAQAGVSFLTAFDLGRVTRGPAWLPRDTVRALGLVPFGLIAGARRVHVACIAPLPRTALRALATLTGWTPEPYLVEDAVWREALDRYRCEAREAGDGLSVVAGGLDALTAQIAAAVEAARSVTVRHARVGGGTWVRVENPGRVADLLVPGEEGPWQAVPMRR